MALRLLKVSDDNRINTILLDAEVERIIPLFRAGKEFKIDMWSEGVDPTNEIQVVCYLAEVHIPEDIGRMDVAEITRLAKAIVAGAGY